MVLLTFPVKIENSNTQIFNSVLFMKENGWLSDVNHISHPLVKIYFLHQCGPCTETLTGFDCKKCDYAVLESGVCERQTCTKVVT